MKRSDAAGMSTVSDRSTTQEAWNALADAFRHLLSEMFAPVLRFVTRHPRTTWGIVAAYAVCCVAVVWLSYK